MTSLSGVDPLAVLRRGREPCRCNHTWSEGMLEVDGDPCPVGDPRRMPNCREALIDAVGVRPIAAVVLRRRGTERRYVDGGLRLLRRAARFAERVRPVDPDLARRACRDPIAASSVAADRAGAVAEHLHSSGLDRAVDPDMDYDSVLSGYVGPTIADVRVDPNPPSTGRLVDARTLAGGARVRRYSVPGRELDQYHLLPVELQLTAIDRAVLHDAAREHSTGDSAGRSPRRAITAAGFEHADASTTTLARVLEKQTTGYGILEDCFADPAVTDVFASAPSTDRPLRIRRGERTFHSNLVFTPAGARAIASQLRRDGGRPFSAATPTVDATIGLSTNDRDIRAAGIRSPATEGFGFAFRAHESSPFTLPALVANGTMTPRIAGVLSLAVEGAAAIIIAGPRGAGKTTLLGALLWELPAATRLIVLEDTPELPVGALAESGRDVQPIDTDRAGNAGLTPKSGLRAALRFGESALVVGEVRGGEAPALFEAMRIGAGGSAVLGTVHGRGVSGVRERVVADLGVEATAFEATDLVVTMERGPDGERRVGTIEEVAPSDVPATTLVSTEDDGLSPAVSRGNSQVLADLAGSEDSYDGVLDRLADRTAFLDDLAANAQVDPEEVVEAHARRRSGSSVP